MIKKMGPYPTRRASYLLVVALMCALIYTYNIKIDNPNIHVDGKKINNHVLISFTYKYLLCCLKDFNSHVMY